MDRKLKGIYQAEFERLAEKANIQKIIWRGKFTKPVTKNYKISICTTCMDRLKDLQLTLTQNMKDNSDYSNIEFVVLDYNSKRDDIESWIKSELMDLVESGKLVYGRTEEPEFYSMTKSRNLAFNLASGDIVNNVDADAYTKPGFATFVNKLANQQPKKAIFAKGKQLLRGRAGFWRREFIEDLGGYDEDIEDYGFDDWDIVNRAFCLGFTLMAFGGQFHDKSNRDKHNTENMLVKDYKYTELRNKIISFNKILEGKIKAENGPPYKVIKNFADEK
tara:strand:+ start:3530 stop:4357 length:828 start_codon:yes stop_codon:yes gene_type:complete